VQATVDARAREDAADAIDGRAERNVTIGRAPVLLADILALRDSDPSRSVGKHV
jgi:hypothetical protein